MSDPDPRSPFWRALHVTYKSARRIIIGVVGLTVVLVGLAMLVLPGPAFIVIPTGLAILGAEFAFARRWLRVLKKQARNGLNAVGLGPTAARQRARRERSLAINGNAGAAAPGAPDEPPDSTTSERRPLQ
jgi:uncharacterized protein (TIGR02611 family)